MKNSSLKKGPKLDYPKGVLISADKYIAAQAKLKEKGINDPTHEDIIVTNKELEENEQNPTKKKLLPSDEDIEEAHKRIQKILEERGFSVSSDGVISKNKSKLSLVDKTINQNAPYSSKPENDLG